MAYFRDLHEWLDFLDSRGFLRRISRPINKDTEMHPLVRFQFRGLQEALTLQVGALLLRAEAWCELGGLDERFEYGFYENT